MVVELLRPEWLSRLEGQSAPGGFHRLMTEGAWFPDCRLLSSSFPPTAVATLATGAYPDLHGVVADNWFDRVTRRAVPARPSELQATTLADEVPQDQRHRIFGIGISDIHVGLLVGRSPARTFSMGRDGKFAARGEQPAWLDEYYQQHPLESLHNAKWMALGAPESAPAMRVLRFDPAHPEEFLLLYRSSPYGQATEFEVARELITREKLGQGDTTDVLLFSSGAGALLGYEVGGDSPLLEQMMLHLDRQLELTLDLLNRTLGTKAFALAVAGAHGAPREPDPSMRKLMAVSGEGLARRLNDALSDRLDKPPARNIYLEKYVYPFLYLNMEAFRRAGLEPRRARSLAGELALRLPAVAGYYTADDGCSSRGAWVERFRNSFHARRSGDVMLSYLPDYIEETASGRGISYGSLYNYDCDVPLFFYGDAFLPGVYENTVATVDAAPTLARVGGFSLPSSATGRVLADALAEEELDTK